MTIAGVAVGATQGYIYLRIEYPHAEIALREAIATAKARGYLGRDVLGSGKTFDLEVRMGAGAYICGEETSLLESLEGKRAEVRFRPPLPAIKGLFGKPTVINNVISLASRADHPASGAPTFYKDYGMGRSRGTLPIQLAGNIKHGGLVEKAFGVTLRELLYDFGGGSASGRPIRAVQVGGPLGAYIPESQFDTPLDYEAFTAHRRAGGPRRHRGLRRHRRHGADGPLRDGVLRDRVLRQVHALPHRLDARRRGASTGSWPVARSAPQNIALLEDLCDTHAARLAVRTGRHDAVPGAECAETFSRRFLSRPLKATENRTMYALHTT